MAILIRRKFTGPVIILTLFIFMLSTGVQAGTIQIPKGTEVKVKFAPGMKITSGELTKDVPLLIYLAEPIKIGNTTIVQKDAQGTAKVIEVKKAGKGGKPGYIKVAFVDFETKGDYRSPDDSRIKLEGEIENAGKSRKTLSYLFIFGLFIKGKQGVISSDVVYNAKVAESMILESK
ncbi:MAG: hypothetical protein JXA92_03410 [candidate division Zixibacteria bacterium]|nr:hypothetical protein [candidate division Zixibacteria bacterium]